MSQDTRQEIVFQTSKDILHGTERKIGKNPLRLTMGRQTILLIPEETSQKDPLNTTSTDMGHIRVLNPVSGKIFIIGESPTQLQRVTFGKDSTLNSFVLDDPDASRSHAELTHDSDGGYVIKDSNSTNGTGVKEIKELPLHSTQVIKGGDVEVFILGDAPVELQMGKAKLTIIRKGEKVLLQDKKGTSIDITGKSSSMGSSRISKIKVHNTGIADIHARLSSIGDVIAVAGIDTRFTTTIRQLAQQEQGVPFIPTEEGKSEKEGLLRGVRRRLKNMLQNEDGHASDIEYMEEEGDPFLRPLKKNKNVKIQANEFPQLD